MNAERPFLRRHYLWPLFSEGCDKRGRLAWVLWRWWMLALTLRWRRRRCVEHEPTSFRIGTLREFRAGGQGRQRVQCAYCSTVIREFSE